MATVTIEELIAERDELRARLAEIDAEHAGERFPTDIKEEWNRLNSQVDEYDERIREIQARNDRLHALTADRDDSTHREAAVEPFHTARPGGVRGGNIYDLASVRRDFNDPAVEGHEMRDRAMRAVESATFPHERANREDVQTHVAKLLERADTEDGQIARHILQTGSPTYKRAFGKAIAQKPLSNEEQRALSLTTTAGGFAVPFVLDPTIIPTSNLAVNPFRAISRVEQITVDEWRGVSSAGVTAAFAAEATEASDNAPTLAQPTVSTEKAQAFIPFSIEIGMDWNGLQTEMARLLQDAKDELEATKFALGSGTNEPFGVITGATTTLSTVGTGAFVVADLYSLEADLGPRFRPRASMVMNRFVAQKIRQFDTAGGANLWIDNLRLGLQNQVPTPGNYGSQVLGYPAYESSAMDATLTTASEIIVMGDFSHFLIADRIGMSIEVIQHLVGTNHRPTGQRGLYCYWRVGSKILAANAFRTLTTR